MLVSLSDRIDTAINFAIYAILILSSLFLLFSLYSKELTDKESLTEFSLFIMVAGSNLPEISLEKFAFLAKESSYCGFFSFQIRTRLLSPSLCHSFLSDVLRQDRCERRNCS